jgi:hypothetical protein
MMELLNTLSFYCINLDQRTDRWARVQHQFDLIGIREKITRVSAVTDFINRNSDLSIGHQSLIETNLLILNRRELSGPICIFEDDVYFLMENRPLDVMAHISSQLPENFGLLYLGAHLFDPKIKHLLISPNLVRLLPEPRPTKEKDHVFLGGTHAVIFSTRAIEYIRSQPTQILFEASWDVFLSKYLVPHFPCFMAHPAFAFQIDDFSDIDGTKTEWNWVFELNKTRIRQGFPTDLFSKVSNKLSRIRKRLYRPS